MNVSKFFDLAKEKGIAQSQIQVGRSSSFNISLFHHEVENYKVSKSQSVVACGIYNDKFGSGRTEKLGKDTFDFLTNQIITSASFIEEESEKEIFPGSPKYHKKNVFNPGLAKVSAEEKTSGTYDGNIEKLFFDLGTPAETLSDIIPDFCIVPSDSSNSATKYSSDLC